LYVAFYFCFSATWFGEDDTAHVAGNDVHCVAENELFVTAFWAFYPQESAAWFGDKFVPFTHVF
jgi:hypothetical protein